MLSVRTQMVFIVGVVCHELVRLQMILCCSSSYSSLPPLLSSALCELHGNTNLEVCNKCGREYLRDYRTRTSQGIFVHFTGECIKLYSCIEGIQYHFCNYCLPQVVTVMTQNVVDVLKTLSLTLEKVFLKVSGTKPLR